MFNVRIKTFYDSEQIQIYSRPQRSKGDVYKMQIDIETGEIFPPLSKDRLYEFDDGTTLEGHEVEGFTTTEECFRRSRNRTIKSIYDIARSDAWEWFFTLTFTKEKIDRYDYSQVSKKLSYWLNNMRKKCPDMKYIVVPEQHADGAWHFHGLFKDVEELDFRFSGHYDKKGRKIFNCLSYKWGFTTATEITDYRKASSYLCKYITKELCLNTSGKKRYWVSRNVKRPKVEELLIDGEYLNLALLECMEPDAFLKNIDGYVGINYVDQSIPQTHQGL